ncbi:hypothetical protein BBP40_008042 [Aspergillus hancockii]|nr:hypothetical protein BBP40_008042 [Aspergillus hancockii]
MGDHHNEPSPYGVGDTLTVQSHNYPPPLSKKEALRRFRPINKDESLSLMELCLQNPPLPGSDSPSFVTIELVERLYGGDDKDPQIFAVRIVNRCNSRWTPTDQDIVAKIYDPLYYDFTPREDNPFLEADYYYTHECAAYARLSDLQGSVIPKFYGSYTLNIKTGQCFRLIRLVLIERVNGLSMDRLNPEEFSKEERQEIMKQIVDAESALYTKDVLHRDLCPLNVVVKQSDRTSLQIVLIDLGKSVIRRSPNQFDSEQEKQWLPGVPISPLLRWNAFYGHQDPFQEWIDWPWQAWLEVQYNKDEASITEEQSEIWAIQDWMLEQRPPLS